MSISKKIVKARAVSVTSLLALTLVLGGWLWAHYALRGITNGPLILHFDDIQGITAVGDLSTITFMGALGTTVVLMNFFIALEFDGRDRFLGKMAAGVTFVFAVLLFIGFVAIIKVN
jgi:hypothetical protein